MIGFRGTGHTADPNLLVGNAIPCLWIFLERVMTLEKKENTKNKEERETAVLTEDP